MDNSYFKDVQLFVEANDCEQHLLRELFNIEFECEGRILSLENEKGLSLGLNCRFANIEGKRVLFYYSSGIYCDWRAIESYLKQFLNGNSWKDVSFDTEKFVYYLFDRLSKIPLAAWVMYSARRDFRSIPMIDNPFRTKKF